MDRWRSPTALLIIAAIAVGVFVGLPDRSRVDPIPVETTHTEQVPPDIGSVTLHVSGAVARPGLVVVPEGSRVADAVAAAGGAARDADLTVVNLAQQVEDGDHLVIPRHGDTRGDPSPSGVGNGDGPIAVNRATVQELEQLPGVGPVLAQRIVDHREAHGPFEAIEDLLDVSGIGERILATLRDLITVP